MPPFFNERPRYERAVAQVRASLGEQAFDAAWVGEGRTMTPEQALASEGRAMNVPPIATVLPLPSHVTSPVVYPDGLTTREVEMLRLLVTGLTNAQVAEQLVIGPRTVDSHLTSIYGKIGVSSRSAATRYALDHHLVWLLPSPPVLSLPHIWGILPRSPTKGCLLRPTNTSSIHGIHLMYSHLLDCTLQVVKEHRDEQNIAFYTRKEIIHEKAVIRAWCHRYSPRRLWFHRRTL
ncbi:MAG: hypothetical protein NVS4B11_06070 [Ktedonobacteraceae bacterium]